MAKPVAVIAGLDGMPLGLLVELMERGVMPWLHSAWKRFAASETEVYVPYTPPSWATISTGVNPGKHGVFDAFTPTPEGGVRLITKMDLERPYVNEMAAAGGIGSINFESFNDIIRNKLVFYIYFYYNKFNNL